MSGQSQELSQQQQLRQRLSPRQMAFGRVLEMSAPEFEEEVRRVLDENPALEVSQSVENEQPADDSFNETAEQLQQADYADPDDRLPVAATRPRAAADWWQGREADDSASGFERLEQQLGLVEIAPRDRQIATYVIGNIDSNGYLARDPQAIADDVAIATGEDVTVDDVWRAMDVVRSLEPAGICALDLRDCLLLQLDRMDSSRTDVADAREIIRRRFDLFSRRQFDKLVAVSDLDRSRVDAAVRVITSLNPKPGSLLEGVGAEDRTRHITPDFIVDTTPEGQVTVALASHVPELAIERTFDLEHLPAGLREADRAFIKARHDEAAEFIGIAHRRSQTLMSVMEAIVKLQPEFFSTYDLASLRPMVLRDVAGITGLDLSVISRATATKYMATPHGLFLLKTLFSEASGAGDDAASAHAVTEAIRAIVEEEDKNEPLSDADIRELLAARGMNLARRTVAKYRERLGFPVARLRRR